MERVREREQTGEPNKRQPNNFPIFAFNPSVQLETKPPLTNTNATAILALCVLDVFSSALARALI